jgi:hypothetical protein
MTAASPRVLMIAQWPSIKNAEYELIERVRRTGFKVGVVDFLGFDVDRGGCVNGADLAGEYDFAISLHYETPKFLNLPTYHWVANPLEFILAVGNYRTHVIHHLRSYDDYLYNGSQVLKEHMKAVVGDEWRDGGLRFFQSCSRNALLAPRAPGEGGAASGKLFYCGVNWEAISDKAGRAQGLLEILQERGLADFYGPQTVLNVNVWAAFSSYRGEIPFDGTSMFPAMHEYAAVLAVSSPAHIKSKTSSGRAVEGFAAGVPVISDENEHVRGQFGDLAYYFRGDTETARADAIQAVMEEIRTRPAQAVERVRAAQELIARDYSFEACFDEILRAAHSPASGTSRAREVVIDVFVFAHDPYAPPGAEGPVDGGNIPHILRAMSTVAQERVRFRLFRNAGAAAAGPDAPWLEEAALPPDPEWERLRLGEKVARLARVSTGDYAVFFTHDDFPQHDYFTKAMKWFSAHVADGQPGLHVGGFFANDLTTPAPMSAAGILRCSASDGLYRWTQNSIAEHQLGQLCFNSAALRAVSFEGLERFDVLFALATVVECMGRRVAIHRSRHVLLRVAHGYYHRYLEAFRRVSGKGLWAQHYELLSNATHEINALFDAFHQVPAAVEIADKILGIDIPPPVFTTPPPTDPAVLAVNHFLNRISPYVVFAKKLARPFGIK